MPARTRLAAAFGAAAFALAVSGAALAAPALVVNASHVAKASAAATILTRQDVSTYRTTVLAPAAYGLPNAPHVGQRIGSATVQVVTAAGALTFTGWIVGVAPDSFTQDRCASFAGESHLAVWLLQVRQVDGLARAEIPVYVDAAPAGRTELTWCASSAADMTVTSVGLTLQRTLTTPVVAGAYAWQAHFDNTVDSRSALGVAPATTATAIVRVRAARH